MENFPIFSPEPSLTNIGIYIIVNTDLYLYYKALYYIIDMYCILCALLKKIMFVRVSSKTFHAITYYFFIDYIHIFEIKKNNKNGQIA